jgi:hypothetical protein
LFVGAGSATARHKSHDSGIRIDEVQDSLDVVVDEHISKWVHDKPAEGAHAKDAILSEASVSESVR